MAFLMEVSYWPVDGQLSIHNESNPWYDNDAAICSPVNDPVTIESLTGESWSYYDGMKTVQNMKGFGSVQLNGVTSAVPAETQVNEFLPTAYEDGCLSDWQMQQILPLLNTAHGVNSVSSPVGEVQPYAVQSPPVQKQSIVHLSLPPVQWPVMPEMGFEGIASSDISVSGTSDDGNVMDLLTQLCDTIDGDVIMDQAELAASYPLLPQVSPEDVDSLLSSDDTWATDSLISASISSYDLVIRPPDSPMSDCGSVSSSGSSCVPRVEKRQRKKEQNKTAALRYRQKKRSEQGTVMTECEDLEKRNSELKTKVSEMMKEIAYLKGLIDEIDS